MSLTSLYPAQGLQNFVDETTNLLVANLSMSAGQLGGSGQFRSSIINRAPIADISQNLRPQMGIERIMFQDLVLLQSEFGSSGEPVYGVLNDDRGLIRFVGEWISGVSGGGADLGSGLLIDSLLTTSVNEYVEITFYGTGLNILTMIDSNSRDLRVTVDGGTEGSNILPNGVNTLTGRGYATNQMTNCASGLALGIHTIKLRDGSTTARSKLYGIEILNESSNIIVNSGSSYANGKRLYSSSQNSSSYNSGFTNVYGTAGTRGGRVLIYQDIDGSIKKDIQYVNTAQANFSSADHTNEEIQRKYNWREFGANRSDDFSTLSSSVSNRAFTLDDGTTSLAGLGVLTQTSSSDLDCVAANGVSGNFIAITFVGTGLDLLTAPNDSNTRITSILVDGVSIGTLTTPGSEAARQVKIVSGLPYGTHIVKFLYNNFNTVFTKGFIVYQPKTPALPVGAIQLGSYNLMANYVASTTTAPFFEAQSLGTLKKVASREWNYVNPSFNVIGLDLPTNIQGNYVGVNSQTTSGGYGEITFFGTGFEFHGATGNYSNSNQLSLQNLTTGGSLLALTSTNFPTASASYSGNGTFTFSTGVYNQNGTSASDVLRISGLPLGLYKMRLTNNGSTSGFYLQFNAIDIITPIHSPKSNSPTSLQNTLLVGSCAISDDRQNQPLKLQSAQKAYMQAIGVSASSTSSGSFIPMPDLSGTIRLANNGKVLVSYAASLFGSVTNQFANLAVFVDGIQVSPLKVTQPPSAGSQIMASESMVIPMSAGVHKVDVYWSTNSGTLSTATNQRSLVAIEL